MNKEEITKEDITKEDILKITGSMFDTMFDYVENSDKEIEQLQQENKQLQQENEKLKLNHKQLSDIKKTMVCNSRLIQENKQLQTTVNNCKQRIDKAIKYIETTKNILNTENKSYYQIIFKKLLEILKGE